MGVTLGCLALALALTLVLTLTLILFVTLTLTIIITLTLTRTQSSLSGWCMEGWKRAQGTWATVPASIKGCNAGPKEPKRS